MGSLNKLLVIILCLCPFVFCSCLAVTPKTSKEDPGPGRLASADSVDSSLVDKWELLYQMNDKGVEEKPRESTKTLIEFTRKGQVIFNRSADENPEAIKSKTGKYLVEKEEINITDDGGNTVKWPYQVTGDTLILTMPEVQKKFYWKRHR